MSNFQQHELFEDLLLNVKEKLFGSGTSFIRLCLIKFGKIIL